MKLTVRLFATLRENRFNENEFEIDSGSDINHLLKIIELKGEEIAIIFINGRHADYNSILKEGDEIAFFPPIGGG